jgi:hypothetical protein
MRRMLQKIKRLFQKDPEDRVETSDVRAELDRLRAANPLIGVVAYTTPSTAESQAPFDRRCPFCGEIAQNKAPRIDCCRSALCTCGAVVIGAAACDYDEVVDDMTFYFALPRSAFPEGRYERPPRGLARLGIDFRVGGSSHEEDSWGGTTYWYWFRARGTAG